uniref:Uncharacterized protein n=1 Tax=Anguilla anguilla TaxID=7936 RepID=A0A0E9S2M5_ANGAN
MCLKCLFWVMLPRSLCQAPRHICLFPVAGETKHLLSSMASEHFH